MITKNYESVNHPPHYNRHPSGVECIDIIEHMPYNIGAAMKYLWRVGLKPGVSFDEDLRKAVWYTEREIERLKRSQHETEESRRAILERHFK